ncbi:MAG: 1-phosphofructokinase [Nitrospiraceae bacterium]
MIYTVTLNPALDRYIEVEDLVVDDANRITSECFYAGGKGIDVSRAIRMLGGESLALGFIGGYSGQLLTDLLKHEGVMTYFTPITAETRRNIIVNPQRRRHHTMLNAQGPIVTKDEWTGFLTHMRLLDLRDAMVVVSGSLPRGVPIDAYAQLVQLGRDRGAKVFVDADGPALRAAVEAKPFGIKPNVNELRRLVGEVISSELELLEAAQQLNRQGIEIVLVSRGPDGVLLVSDHEWYRAVPPAVAVQSAVGAGDSTVAGFVLKYCGGKGLEECVRFATACGTAATLAPGNSLCLASDVERLFPKVQVTAIGPARAQHARRARTKAKKRQGAA